MNAVSWVAVWGCTVVSYSIWRILNRYAPWFYGSSLSDVMWGLEEEARPSSLVVRFIAPLVGGMLFAAVSSTAKGAEAFLVGAQAGLLAVWPNVVRPDHLPWRLWSKRQAVFILYALFIVSCAFASVLGSWCVRIGREWDALGLTGLGRALVVELLVMAVLFVVRGAWTGQVRAARELEQEEHNA